MNKSEPLVPLPGRLIQPIKVLLEKTRHIFLTFLNEPLRLLDVYPLMLTTQK